MAEESKDSQLDVLLDELAPRLRTPKADLVVEIEMRLTALLGVEVGEAFRAVAARQQHAASSLNIDHVHKSGLVLLAHVLEEAMNRTHES